MTNDTASAVPVSDNGLIFVFSAPSGAGKTSVLHEILKIHPEIEFSVSVTTRPPRGDERYGVDYHFMSEEEFETRVKKGDFIEWAVVHGHRYGTLKSAVQEAVDSGQTIILDTDTVGAFNIKKFFPDAVLIFIAPPSPEILNERLRNRKTESPEFLEKRLSVVPHEMKQMKFYDYIVLNDTLKKAVARVNSIMMAERLKSGKILPKLSEWRKYLVKTESAPQSKKNSG